MIAGETVPNPTRGRRWGWWQVVAAVVVGAGVLTFVVGHRAEIPAAWAAVRGADVRFLAVAVAATILWLVNLAMFHAAGQRLAGAPTTTAELILPATIANALNLVVKGNMAGLVPLVGEGRRRGVPRPTVVIAYVVVMVVGEWAFAVALLAALIAMVHDGALSRAELVASAIFAVLLILKAVAAVAATRSPDLLARASAVPGRIWARLRRRPPSSGDAAGARELIDAVAAIRSNPGRLGRCLVHAGGVELIGMAELWAVLHALGYGSITRALVGYSIGVLFSIVSFLPGGLGFVEVSVAAALTSLGMPGAAAAAAVVLYRICELWLPLLAGALGYATARRISRSEPGR